ncbi:Solute carrier family 40 member 1, partial [Tolypocladium capitatum]
RAGGVGGGLGAEDGRRGRGWGRDGLFAALCVLAGVEKLASMANTVAVERDWVVVMTDGDENWRRGERNSYTRSIGRSLGVMLAHICSVVNARLRRIDLLCKLLGPLAISLVAMASTLMTIWTVLGMNVVSVSIEYVCIARVYKSVPALRRTPSGHDDTPPGPHNHPSRSWLNALLPISSLPFYARHPVLLPSLALALLYLTVLSFSGQMVTFLLSVGYTPLHVGVARTASTAVELAATWASPRLVRRLGPVRGGIWSLSLQMTFLAAGSGWFLAGFSGTPAERATSATGLAVCVALSRLGLWGYDFCAQIIVQDDMFAEHAVLQEVEADYRGTFSAVEAAFQNLFELLSFVTTIIFSRPDQFRWPVIISVVAVYIAGGLYTLFVRRRRGHLFHAPPCLRPKPDGPVALP